jgi:hypothetical protein
MATLPRYSLKPAHHRVGPGIGETGGGLRWRPCLLSAGCVHPAAIHDVHVGRPGRTVSSRQAGVAVFGARGRLGRDEQAALSQVPQK